MKPQEYFQLVSGEYPAGDVKNLAGDLPYLLSECIGVTQNKFHSENVFEHLLYSLNASTQWTDDPLLRLAILLHDVGKPASKTEDKDGVHFYCHEIIGAQIAYQWMTNIGFDSKDCQYVSWAIRNHMFQVNENAGLKTAKRWLRDMGPNWHDLIIIRLADRVGNLANKDRPIMTRTLQSLQDKITEVLKIGGPIFENDLAINRYDIKKIGIPLVKVDEAIEKCWSCVLNKAECNTKEWLKDFIIRNYKL